MNAADERPVRGRRVARAPALLCLVPVVMVVVVLLAVSLHPHVHGLAHTLYHTAGVRGLVDALGYRTVHGLYYHLRALARLP